MRGGLESAAEKEMRDATLTGVRIARREIEKVSPLGPPFQLGEQPQSSRW